MIDGLKKPLWILLLLQRSLKLLRGGNGAKIIDPIRDDNIINLCKYFNKKFKIVSGVNGQMLMRSY